MVDGWNPCKSFGGQQLFKVDRGDDGGQAWLPYKLKNDVDPYAGTDMAHQMRIEMLEFKADVFEDLMDAIRRGETGLEWTISELMDTDEYHEHMVGKKRIHDKKDPRRYKWQSIRTDYPDHLHLCELMQVVLAHRLEVVSFEAVQIRKKKDK